MTSIHATLRRCQCSGMIYFISSFIVTAKVCIGDRPAYSRPTHQRTIQNAGRHWPPPGQSARPNATKKPDFASAGNKQCSWSALPDSHQFDLCFDCFVCGRSSTGRRSTITNDIDLLKLSQATTFGSTEVDDARRAYCNRYQEVVNCAAVYSRPRPRSFLARDATLLRFRPLRFQPSRPLWRLWGRESWGT